MPFDKESLQQLQAHAKWLCRRLQMMSAGELALRLRDRVRFAVWRRGRAWSAPRFVDKPAQSAYRLPAAPGQDGVQEVVEQAEELLAGRFVALNQTFSVGDVEWHRDPQSEVTAPLRFGPTLDYRDRRIAGNARNIWELNRHQYLTTAALAYALTGEERFAVFVRRQLDSWLDQNPFPLGVNWASPLELGLRLISWVWVSRFLAGSPETESLFGEHGRLWPAIYRHQWMIAKLQSFGSSANNHLVGEMAGLFISTVARTQQQAMMASFQPQPIKTQMVIRVPPQLQLISISQPQQQQQQQQQQRQPCPGICLPQMMSNLCTPPSVIVQVKI